MSSFIATNKRQLLEALTDPEISYLFVFVEGLDSIPKDIKNLPHLKVLRLYKTCIKKLVLKEIYPNLKELYIEYTEIRDLDISETALEKMHAVGNPISKFKCSSNSELKTLTLIFGQLKTLPKEIGLLSNLKELRLYGNPLKTLPKEIGNLSELRELSVADTLITELPKEIKNLKKLQLLNLSSVPLKRIPSELKELINLEQLTLQGVRFLSLRQICFIPSLRRLHLCDCALTSLPKEIGNLSNLEVLNVSYNQLTKLPSCISKLQNLKRLYAHENKIEKLPASIKELRKLECLNLSYNKLKFLPKSLMSLDLKHIGLSGNVDLPPSLRAPLSGKSLDRLKAALCSKKELMQYLLHEDVFVRDIAKERLSCPTQNH